MSRRYHITGVFGDAENGKTTYMVDKLGRELDSKQNYDYAACNLRSACERDPRIRFVNYHDIVTFRGPTKDGLARTLMGLDQFPKYMDARKSMSPLNIMTSHVMIEGRQHGADFIFTTWGKKSVDNRVRPFTNLFVLAQKGRRGFEYELIDKAAGTIQDGLIDWDRARRTWKKFDSTELIEDPTIPIKKQEFEALEEELKQKVSLVA